MLYNDDIMSSIKLLNSLAVASNSVKIFGVILSCVSVEAKDVALLS